MSDEKLTRRKFLKKSVTGAAVIGLFPDVLANFGMTTKDGRMVVVIPPALSSAVVFARVPK